MNVTIQKEKFIKHFLSLEKKEPVLRKKQSSPAAGERRRGAQLLRKKGKAPDFYFLQMQAKRY